MAHPTRNLPGVGSGSGLSHGMDAVVTNVLALRVPGLRINSLLSAENTIDKIKQRKIECAIMKRLKCLLFLLMILPVTIFSQQLEERDIEIFINGLAEIANTLHENDSSDEFKNYTMLFAEALQAFNFIHDNSITDDEVIIAYNDFLNCNIPMLLENKFKSIGWEINGQKKFCAIIFGLGYDNEVKEPADTFYEFLSDTEKERINNISARFLLVFDERDLNLIEKNREKLKTLMNKS